MEKQMNIKRALIVILLTLMVLPSLVQAQDRVIRPAEGTAVIIVQKVFMDGNDESEVTLRMQCATGNPVDQQVTLTASTKPGYGPYEAAFVLENIPNVNGVGATCWVTEDVAALSGYSPTYRCDASDANGGIEYDDSDDSCGDDNNDNPRDYSVEECRYFDIRPGDIGFCWIYNDPDPVQLVITKDWVLLGSEGQTVEQETDISVRCDNDAEILGPSTAAPYYNSHPSDPYKWYAGKKKSRTYFTAKDVDGDAVITLDVIPGWPSSDCEADENIVDSAVEKTEVNCEDMEISEADGGDSCKMTNTIFYEGIPTLSQYGLAIMALLMLGVGFVGFRRFV